MEKSPKSQKYVDLVLPIMYTSRCKEIVPYIYRKEVRDVNKPKKIKVKIKVKIFICTVEVTIIF